MAAREGGVLRSDVLLSQVTGKSWSDASRIFLHCYSCKALPGLIETWTSTLLAVLLEIGLRAFGQQPCTPAKQPEGIALVCFCQRPMEMGTALSLPKRAKVHIFILRREKGLFLVRKCKVTTDNLAPSRPFLSVSTQPKSHSGGGQRLGSVLRQGNAYSSGKECFPGIPPDRIQWRKYAFLDGMWGTEKRS